MFNHLNFVFSQVISACIRRLFAHRASGFLTQKSRITRLVPKSERKKQGKGGTVSLLLCCCCGENFLCFDTPETQQKEKGEKRKEQKRYIHMSKKEQQSRHNV